MRYHLFYLYLSLGFTCLNLYFILLVNMASKRVGLNSSNSSLKLEFVTNCNSDKELFPENVIPPKIGKMKLLPWAMKNNNSLV